MYLTAHRVLSATGESGINAFLHAHGTLMQPALETPNAIASVADANPGTIVAQACDVPPGGNRVLSFIDIVAPDPCLSGNLRAALEQLQEKVVSVPLPISAVINGIGLRFGATFGLYDELPKEYGALVQRALALLEQHAQGS